MTRPTAQRCPECGEPFIGSDCIGRPCPDCVEKATTTPTPAPEAEALIEQFVQMMLRAGIATGHGDTFEGLLAETEAHVRSQSARIRKLEAERDNAVAVARSHAMEAKTANATIREAYQAITGSRGELGNWRGADPIKAVVAERDRLASRVERLRGALEPFATEAERWGGYDNSEALVDAWPGGPASSLNVGHLRTARATYEETEE